VGYAKNANPPYKLGLSKCHSLLTPIRPYSFLFSFNGLIRSNNQKTSGQQRLHVPSTIGQHVNVDARADDTVDNAIRLKENLAVVSNTKRREFFRIGAAPWIRRKAVEDFFDLRQHMLGFRMAVVIGDVGVNVNEGSCCACSVSSTSRLI